MKGYKLSRGGVAIAAALLIIVIICGAAVAVLSGDRIRPNISINGIDVSDLTRKEAINRLNGIYSEKIESSFVSMKFEDKEWKVKYSDLDYSYNIEEMVGKAYEVGRSGDFLSQITESIRARFKAQNFELDDQYSIEPIKKLLADMAKEIDQEVVDATIKYSGTAFDITEEQVGRRLNVEQAESLVIEQLHKVDVAVIDLPVDIVQPEIKKADLVMIQDKMGEYSTTFNAADVDRTTNIKVATKSTASVLVKPGQVYSVNETIGPRMAKYGYKNAKVIINNELVPGIGGGVCQVSSTLYNAVLLSNLKIIERRNHSLTLPYVGLGRDATISGDYIDFKFMNNTQYPVYIYGEVKGSWVKFTIFGRNEHPGRVVKIHSNVIKTLQPAVKIIEDPTLPVGTEIEEKKAHIGYVVKTYRMVYENGKEISRETLGSSTYRKVDGVKRVGTKPAPKPIPTPQPTGETPLPETPGQGN